MENDKKYYDWMHAFLIVQSIKNIKILSPTATDNMFLCPTEVNS